MSTMGDQKKMSQDEMMRQAQSVWAMLEEMSERDPKAYRSFIDKHLAEGKEAMRPPQPHMCIATRLTGFPSGRFFLNVFSWQKMKAPANEQEAIPVFGGPVYLGKDDKGDYQVISVAFNPSVLKDYGLDCRSEEERQMLIHLALDFVCDVHKFKLSRDYSILCKDEKCKGSLKKAQESILKKVNGSEDDVKNELGDLENMFGPMAAGCTDSLMKELSNISAGKDEANNVITDKPLSQEIKMPFGDDSVPKQKSLIVEMDDSRTHPVTPQHDLTKKDDRMLLKIKLPGVLSVAECQLDISDKDVLLKVEGQYHLQLPLPQVISVENSSAKFSKRSSTLTLTLQVKS
ncbi:hypothetical protein CAPTEDRAFT_21160 [Capitella teleta]|uniref:PIH1 domain-containing protein 2 n=1 Tax=Capitella teleta TaxID=283909 RepID=R7V2U8_CAPTE|nr:hypothetical protein CAPTEDRAFT_21160 [Capitella teleta]|eukprot:ELU10021.1 hypothetical protein CAPTEDRAFT_21160 [Capitella teleta]